MPFLKKIKQQYAEADEVLKGMKGDFIKPQKVVEIINEKGERWVLYHTPFRQRLSWAFYVFAMWLSAAVIWIVLPFMGMKAILNWLSSP